MNDKHIRKAMYALPDGVVVRRRKPIIPFLLMFVAGFALIIFSDLDGEVLSHNLSLGILTAGVTLTVISGMVLSLRFPQKRGAPAMSDTGEYLIHKEYNFDRSMRADLLQWIAAGDIEKIISQKPVALQSIVVSMYRTQDNRFAAMQAYEFVELEFKPISEIKIVRR